MAAVAGLIEEEVARFDAMAGEWWDPSGPMAALHRINPVRLGWLQRVIGAHFRRTPQGDAGPLDGLCLLDIGCGAGLLAEPLSRMGAEVTGIDPAPSSIEIARRHAEATGARLAYRCASAEDLAAEGAKFDVVLAMEVIEHVGDVAGFVGAAAALVKPGGLLAMSTLNRTLKSFALAIVGAEYVLRWVPQGTHRWEQFVTPDEASAALRAAGFETKVLQGMTYQPLRGAWTLSADTSVNYFIAAQARPVAG